MTDERDIQIRPGDRFRNLAGSYVVIDVNQHQALYSFRGHGKAGPPVAAAMALCAFRRLAAKASRETPQS